LTCRILGPPPRGDMCVDRLRAARFCIGSGQILAFKMHAQTLRAHAN
jgi:hypothetical protein